MESQGILQNQRFRTAVILATIVAGFYIALNIFVVGGTQGGSTPLKRGVS